MADHLVDLSTAFSSRDTRKDSHDFIDTLGAQSYGTIIFGRNQSNRASFIRVPSTASPAHVKQLLVRRCENKRPSLVISVTGSAREYNMKSKLFRIFRQGLLKVAKTADMWIITGGINTSITKLIGEVIRTNPDPSRPIHLIGIAPWGCISGVEQLDVHGSTVIYAKPIADQTDETPLEPNHTQFVFVDDGTKHQYGGEIDFRTQLEKSISSEPFDSFNDQPDHSNQSQTEDKSTSSCSTLATVPVVLLVIDGGLETIRKVYESVIQNQIPVVLLEGTGGCCDLFAKCYHLYNEYRPRSRTSLDANVPPSPLSEQMQAKLQERLRSAYTESILHAVDAHDGTDYVQLIFECIDTRMILLNFIDFKTHHHIERDVDLAILQALLNATNSSEMNAEQKFEQLNLAVEWNRVDIVSSFIMKSDRDWAKVNLNELFFKALLRNQTGFVQLFFDHDFSVNNLFQSPRRLLALYQNENYIFKHDFDDPLRTIYKDIIHPLIGDFFEIDAVFFPHETSRKSNEERPSNATIYFHSNTIDVEKELFLWAILTGRQELALLFWSRGKNKVCAALIATLLYKSKARKEKDARYNEWANQFESLAVQILEKFYRIHPSKCARAILREIPQFGNVTWLHLAVMAEAKLFIAQRAVQNVLGSIWYGHIDRDAGNAKIIFSTLMLWYSGFLPYHQEAVDVTKDANYGKDSTHMSSFIRHDVSRLKHVTDKSTDRPKSRFIGDDLDEEQMLTASRPNMPSQKIRSSWSEYRKKVSKFVEAPYVKYLYNLYSHIVFLMLFSYVILCDFFPLYKFTSDKCVAGSEDNVNVNITSADETQRYSLEKRNRPATTELILIFWMITLFFEEIRQVMAIELQSIRGKIVGYLSIFWNKLDFFSVLLFFVGVFLRFYPSSHCFCAARIVLAVDLSIWYIRTLDLFSAVKRLGPTLVMIGEMVHDMKFFMLMLAVFILAFGVPAYSLMYGVEKWSWHMPRTLLNMAYWEIFGELIVLEDIEKNYDISGYVVLLLLIAYMTMTSVLLINLLIAMFSNTFDRLQADTDYIWKFQHYSLVCYHLTRPILPPPLIIISHVWRVILYVCSHQFHSHWFHQKYIKHKNKSKLRIFTDERTTRSIEAMEDALGNEVYYFFSKIARKQIDYLADFDEERIHSPQEIILNKIKTLENRVRGIQNQQDDVSEYMEYLMNGIKKIGGDDIEMPKRNAQRVATSSNQH